MTETDMIIYRAIVKNMNTVIYMRIRDLAGMTYCSTASIQRFCQKFDCSGWAEFKTRLRLYLDHQAARHAFPTDLDSGEIVRSIMETDTTDSQRKIDQAADLLFHRSQVLWFGCGTSRILSEFGALTYSSLINMSLAINDPLNSPLINFDRQVAEQSCLVVCSVSGENRLVIKYVADFMKHDIPVIAITSNANSTVAKMAQYDLTYFATVQNVAGANVTTQTPALFLIEKLIRRVSSLKHVTDPNLDTQENMR
ncbi:MurR/RpiR family transcriptional regulator [Lactiplantibacillus carotarum]|uniref:MurR/RpiR family transcriptional regulator n=1 Tax=Lactiplantibacillus carotarum TaxID=2993456 RepID=UPI00298EE4F9|nr:MurR/RpiR family transcriptional regulator [Lactiplantibacillus carotarum]